MRIIETVFPLSVPQTPRVFTLEVTEDELDNILDGLDSQGYEDMGDQIAEALDR